jgi:hypothetical protein
MIANYRDASKAPPWMTCCRSLPFTGDIYVQPYGTWWLASTLAWNLTQSWWPTPSSICQMHVWSFRPRPSIAPTCTRRMIRSPTWSKCPGIIYITSFSCLVLGTILLQFFLFGDMQVPKGWESRLLLLSYQKLCKDHLGARQSRPIEIEMSRHVKMSFFKMSRLSQLSKLTLKKMLRSRLSIETLSKIETLGHKLCWDLSRCCFSNCQEYIDSSYEVFQTIENFSTVETWYFKLLRSRVLIETNWDPQA